MSRVTLSLLLALCACTVCAGDQPKEKVAKDEPKEKIAALTGDYYKGDGLGMNCRLVVMPGGRFSFTWRGCLGLYGENKGTAKLANGHVILAPEQRNKKDEFGTATNFIPVKWGTRRYLVAREEMKSFCSAVNLGSEPRDNVHGSFYLRLGDEKNKVTGTPTVPKDWEAYLLKEPFHGKVIKVLADGRARIDCGTERGVWKGMELCTDDLSSVEVVEVEPKTSIIREMFTHESLKSGQQVHSRLPRDD